MQGFTLLTGHLQRWENEAKNAMTSTKNALDKRELSLGDLRSLISTCGDRSSLLSNVKDMIHELETILETAQHQYDEQQRGRGMDFLPVEIIAHIFHLTCFEQARGHNPLYCQSLSRLFCLARVDRLWREIALGTPHLWSNVLVTRNTSPLYLSFILHHSKASPLTLSIEVGPGPASTNFAHLPANITSFNNELNTFPPYLLYLCRVAAPRCRLLSIARASDETCNALLNQLVKPSLEELYLHSSRVRSPFPAINQHHTLPELHAPNLKNLVSSHLIDPSGVLVGNLTHINTHCDVLSILQITAICPHLVKATFRIQMGEIFQAQPPIVCHQLRHLELDLRSETRPWLVLYCLFTALSWPLLETLSLAIPWDLDFHAVQLAALPTPCFETVTKLILDFWDGDRSEVNYRAIEYAFAMCPNIRHLECKHFAPSRLRRTLEHRSAAMILPQVEVLVLEPWVDPGVEASGGSNLLGSVDDIAAIVDCWRSADVGEQHLRTVILNGESSS